MSGDERAVFEVLVQEALERRLDPTTALSVDSTFVEFMKRNNIKRNTLAGVFMGIDEGVIHPDFLGFRE
jgi:hypothetical protein